MKIAIIGTGEVGGTLGRLWAAKGHVVTFGSRKPGSAKTKRRLLSIPDGASAGTPHDAAASSEVVVLATPWEAVQASLKACGGALKGKVLIDCTNPYSAKRRRVELDVRRPGAARVAGWAKGARVVKAFNTTGANLFGSPRFAGGRISMFICGDDARAKKTVAELAGSLGFDVVDTGPLSSALWLEALCGLWLQLAPKMDWTLGFQVLRK
jgi:8-hydroxy-5-deazaflavin:NADPH oxidoreductase